MQVNKVYEGDCLDIMKGLPDNCIDTIITDPPYSLSSIKKRFSKTSINDANQTGFNAKNGTTPHARLSAGFMGKEWDNEIAFNPEVWREALRVAKPGAYLMAFGGTRTHHRLACAIEDAGWEIRDCVTYLNDGNQAESAFMASLNQEQLAAYLELHYPSEQIAWVYGSGMGLGYDVSKGIDKAAIVNCPECNDGVINIRKEYYCVTHGKIDDGEICLDSECKLEWVEEYDICPTCKGVGQIKGAEREVIDSYKQNGYLSGGGYVDSRTGGGGTKRGKFATGNIGYITAPATPLAAKFSGFRSRLKPAFEPICIAMKPVDTNYATNAERWGLAGLDIDGARVEANGEIIEQSGELVNTSCHSGYDRPNATAYRTGKPKERSGPANSLGRYPANIIHDGSEQVEAEFAKAGVSISRPSNIKAAKANRQVYDGGDLHNRIDRSYSHNDIGSASRFFATCPPDLPRFIYQAKASPAERGAANSHPTVKPLALIRELVKLTRPPDGGVVLDPFAGSGTTALACLSEGRDYILIEKEPDYCEIIKRRIAEYTGQEIAPKEVEVKGETVKQMPLW